MLLAYVAQPFRDLQNARGGRTLDPSTIFFVSLWLYALYTAFFESIFFEGNSSLFQFLIIALFGLRFSTKLPAV